MIKATDFASTVQTQKDAKFKKMMSIQEQFIKEKMSSGGRSIIWIFSDKEYYNNDLERSWFYEFEEKAKQEFKKKGFSINGILIKW